MPTLIDSLYVALKLDPKDFVEGQKKATESFEKTRKSAQEQGTLVEKSADGMAKGIERVTMRVLELYAAFLGARGLKEFVADLTSADAALGRFSKNIGESPQTMSAWQMAAERMGGTANATASTFERIGKALYDLTTNGKRLPDEFSRLQALTHMQIDPYHGIDKYLTDIAAALQKLYQMDPAKAHFIAQGLGIDDATANVMFKYGAAVKQHIDQLERLSPSNGAIKAAQELQDRWATLTQTATKLANVVMATLGPEIGKLLTQMTEWVTKNQAWLKTRIVEAVQQLAQWLRSIDWKAIAQGINSFVHGADQAAKFVGGWAHAGELLFGLWLGEKFLRVLANVRMLAAASTGGGASLLGLLGIAGAAGAGAYDVTQPKTGNFAKHGFNITPLDWLNSLIAGNGNTAKSDSVKVDGRPVSRANPLPVRSTDQNDGGGGFWSSLGSAIGGVAHAIFGGGGAPTPSAGVGKWWTPERQQEAYNRLRKEAHLSDAGARALVARWATVEAPGGPTSANDIGGGHYGIAQWGKSRGGVWNDPNFQHQLSYAIRELNTTEHVAGDALRRAKTAGEGAVGASMYERAGGYNSLTGTDAFTRKTLSGMGKLSISAPPGVSVGAGAAVPSTINHNQNSSVSQTSETHIGEVNIHTKATDAAGIARDFKSAMNRQALATHANYGLA